MLIRTLTTIGIIAVVLPILLFSDTWIFPVFVAACTVIGVNEMLGCVGMRKKWLASVPMYIVAAALPLSVRLFPNQAVCLITMASVMFVLLIYMLSLSVFSRDRLSIDSVCVTFSASAYVVVSFTCMIILRDAPNGFFLLIAALGGPWASDVLAYLFGRFFGKHKLIPEISPKKTWEGAIGAVLGTGVVFFVYGLCVNHLTSGVVSKYHWMLIAGLIVSVVSQVGDLIFSAIKRTYGIKDYGKLLPGHGGILDRFDSVLAVVPLLLMLYAIPYIFEMFV